jgi:F-type H+-transporting ATPase subunit b
VQLDWSTIVLEIVNFLVLVWILKRFLYRPVLDVISRRKAAIEESIAGADAKRAEAQTLKAQYENRLADWERERAAARETLAHDLDEERRRRMAELEKALAAERDKARVADERRLAEFQRRAEEQAVAQGARFAGRLLEHLSGPELDARLVALALEGLAALPQARRAELRAGASEAGRAVEVQSARALDADARKAIEAGVQGLIGTAPAIAYREDPALVAGVRILLGPWVLRASIQDELQGLAELSHGPAD